MLKWIFFDVGNVLFNDDPQNCFVWQFLWEKFQQDEPGLTFAELMVERERRALAGENWITKKMVTARHGPAACDRHMAELRKHLKANFDHNHLVNHGVPALLQRLKSKYRLGVIANQPAECRASLRRRGLLPLFDLVGISEELKLYKPNPELYEWAASQVDAQADECVMVGDRIDNDVHPAQQIGMKTIHVVWPSFTEKNWEPDEPHAREFLESCDRVPLFGAAARDAVPDAVVNNMPEIADVIETGFTAG